MSEMIQVEDGSTLTYRRTPWDERAFGVATCEILSINARSDESFASLLTEFNKIVQQDQIGLISTRVSAEDRTLVEALQRAGFLYVETSLRMCLQRVQKFVAPRRLSRNLILRQAGRSETEQLKAIATHDFHYGRFAEDPLIPKTLNDRRQANWIDDILEQGLTTWHIENRGAICAFMSVKVEDQTADLVLGGCREGFGVLFMPFVVSLIEELKQASIHSIFATISAANLGVLNCYTGVGFYAKDTLVGLHRHVIRLQDRSGT